MRGLKAIYPIAAALAVAACATVPPPDDEISQAESAISRAERSQAREFAAFELEQSQRKLESAKELSEGPSEERAEARRLATQAALDARLAQEKAQLGRARETYEELRRALDGAEPATREGATQ